VNLKKIDYFEKNTKFKILKNGRIERFFQKSNNRGFYIMDIKNGYVSSLNIIVNFTKIWPIF